MIRILYFGRLREDLAMREETLDWQEGDSEALIARLRSRGPEWAEALAPGRVFRVVVDRVMVRGAQPVPDGAEVGILPPVTGG